MEFSAKQASLLAHSDSFFNLADGAVRSGKTHTHLIRYAEWCAQSTAAGDRGQFALFGKTERTVKRNVIAPLKALFPKNVKYNQGQGEVHIFGKTCSVVGANDVGAADKVQGWSLSKSYANEVALYPETFFLTMLNRHSDDGAQILADCNPDSPHHYLNRDYLAADKSREFIKRWRFQLSDNPVLSQRYKEMLIEAHPPGTLWHKRMVLGEWVQAEGAIYEQWDERFHVVDEMPGIPEVVHIAIDYGTQNATVFLALGRVAGIWYVFAEYYHSGKEAGHQKTDAEYSLDLRRFVQDTGYYPQSVVIDPSAASFKVQLRKDGMTNLRDADNAVIDGIRVVSTALSGGQLKVLRRCERLRAEFPSYVWDDKKQARGEDAPLKGEGVKDHCFVAGTSVKSESGDVPIESLRPGKKVWTRRGLKPVVLNWATPDRQLWEAEFSDGGTLKGTGNHPVFVEDKGFVCLDALRYGDIIETWQESKPLSSTGSSLGDTLTRHDESCEAITARAETIGKEAWAAFTKRFGRRLSGLFLTGIMSIIVTKTLSTMTSQISPAFRPPNTCRNMGKHVCLKIYKSLRRLDGNLLPSGIGPRRAEHGTESTGSGRGPSGSHIVKNVSSAVHNSTVSLDATMTVSALTPASLGGAEQAVLTTKPVSARYATLGSEQTSTGRQEPVHVLAVRRLEQTAPVYNLTVADAHEFYANGILVHNCLDSLRYGAVKAIGRPTLHAVPKVETVSVS